MFRRGLDMGEAGCHRHAILFVLPQPYRQFFKHVWNWVDRNDGVNVRSRYVVHVNLVQVHALLRRLSLEDFDQRVCVGWDVVECQKGAHEISVDAVDLLNECHVAEVSIVCV